MGERSHPPCEGWQGNVAGGNGFPQSAETEGRSLGAAVPHSAVRLPRLCQRLLSERWWGDTHCICLSVFLQRRQRNSKEDRVFDYYLGPPLTRMDRHWHSGLQLHAHIFLPNASPDVKSNQSATQELFLCVFGLLLHLKERGDWKKNCCLLKKKKKFRSRGN